VCTCTQFHETNLTDIVGATHGTAINALARTNLVAGAAAGAPVEQRLIAAGRHGGEGVFVDILEAASTTCKSMEY
jgi:hypothetical protein